MKPRVILAWLVRLAATVGVLTWVMHHDDVREGLHAAQFVHPGWMVAAFASGGIAAICAAWRWHLCLRACDCALPFGTVLRISLAGSAAGLWSIGSLGVDAVRVTLASRRSPARASDVLASVALDHVSALPAFLALSATVISVLGVPATLNRNAMISIGSIALVCLVFALGVRAFHRAWHDRFVSYTLTKLRAPGTGSAALVSLPLLIANYGIFVCAARSFDVHAATIGLFGASVIADSIASLPITIAGIGVREKAFAVLLGSWYGVPTALAVLTSLSGLMVLAMWAVVGVLAFPMRDRSLSLDAAHG